MIRVGQEAVPMWAATCHGVEENVAAKGGGKTGSMGRYAAT